MLIEINLEVSYSFFWDFLSKFSGCPAWQNICQKSDEFYNIHVIRSIWANDSI